MPRRQFERSPEFGARLQGLLARTGVLRQRVARHLAKVYAGSQSADFRAWEGRLVRYAAGLVPQAHDLEAIVRALVRPPEKVPEVVRWLLKGGAEPNYVASLDETPGTSLVLAPMSVPSVQVARPATLLALLREVASGSLAVEDAADVIAVLVRPSARGSRWFSVTPAVIRSDDTERAA